MVEDEKAAAGSAIDLACRSDCRSPLRLHGPTMSLCAVDLERNLDLAGQHITRSGGLRGRVLHTGPRNGVSGVGLAGQVQPLFLS